MVSKKASFSNHRICFYAACFLGAVFLTTLTSTAWAGRTVTINPASGPYGTLITVKGAGYNSKNKVTIKYEDANSVSNIKPDAAGNIDTTITANGDKAGNYTIQAFEYDQNDNFIGKSNAVTFKQTSGKKSTHAIAVFDFPNTMLLTSLDLKGRRLSPIEKEDLCLGESAECFGVIPAPLPLGKGGLIISTALGFQNDVHKYSAQQFSFLFDKTFTPINALDGPVITGTVANRNCWYLYGEPTKISLTHLKGNPQADVQLVGNIYNPANATAGPTKKYLPKIDQTHFQACFGTRDIHAAIIEKGNDFDFEIQYKGKDNVLRSLLLPVFVPNSVIISADITNRYETLRLPNETLIVRMGVPNFAIYDSQVFTLRLDVSRPQWEVAGNPVPITKRIRDTHLSARGFHSVAIDPLGGFAVYTYPSGSTGVVKSQQLDPYTGENIGKPRIIFRRSYFGPEAGPYGLGLSFLF